MQLPQPLVLLHPLLLQLQHKQKVQQELQQLNHLPHLLLSKKQQALNPKKKNKKLK